MPFSVSTFVPLFQTLDGAPYRLASRSLEGPCNALGDWLFTRGPMYQLTAEKIGLLKPAVQIGLGLQELKAYLDRKEAALRPLLPEGSVAAATFKTWDEVAAASDRLFEQWTRLAHRPDALLARIEVFRRDMERAQDAKLPGTRDAQERARKHLAYFLGLVGDIVQTYERIDPHEDLHDVIRNVELELSSIVDSHTEKPDESPGLMDNLQVYVSAHQLKAWYAPRSAIGDETRGRWVDVLHEAGIRILTTSAVIWGAAQVHPR